MNLAALKNKPIARPPKGVKVITATQVQAEAKAEEKEEPHPPYKEGNDGAKEAKEVKKVFVVDKTQTTTLDRDIIMKRLMEMKTGIKNGKNEKNVENVEKGTKDTLDKSIPNEKRDIDLGNANLETLDLDKELPSKVQGTDGSAGPSKVQEDKEEKAPPPKKIPVKKVVVGEKKPAHIEKRIIYEGDINELMIGSEKVETRLPPPRREVVKASSYYMNNRRLFQQKLSDLFKVHKAELMQPDDDVNCDFRKEGSKFELLTHQKIVSDYLNLYSPYRGLLIYHGLGSGKTCTSIAIAEGMKSDRPIYILTPASLSTNYMSELKKCGDPLYKKNQFWEFVDTKREPTFVAPLAIIMSLTEDYVKAHGGVWMVNVKKDSNFEDLSKDQKEEIEDQIDEMIKAKYRNINYNANNFMAKVDHYGGGGANPFDNSVVIVDEGHNLVSRIVNKLKRPQSNSVKLYKYLMSAVNAKVVFLSGTPIINYPNEIAIMFNMLRGYIKTWTFEVKTTTSEKINRDEILKWFDRGKFKLYDFVEYSGNKLTVTRNPYGFVNVKKRAGAGAAGAGGGGGAEEESTEFNRYGGVTLGEDGKMSDADFEETIKGILKKNKVNVESVKSINHTALPDDKEAFLNMFVDPDTGNMKNVDLFQRRILGLTSYFKSAQEKLLPRYSKARDFTVVRCEMDEYQFAAYAEARKTERDKEKKRRVQRKQAKTTDELYSEMSSTYRVFSRSFCNFAFPDPPGRPMPPPPKKPKFAEGKEAKEKRVTEEKYYKVLDVTPAADEDEVRHAYKRLVLIHHPDKNGNVEKFRQVQEAHDKIMETFDHDDEDEINENAIDASEVDEETGDETKDATYMEKIESAFKYLKEHEKEYLTQDRLPMYSNKMSKLMENVLNEDYAGLHLIYSQFRTLEGIGIIKLILEANGFAEFKLIKRGGEWAIKEVAEGDEGKPRFVLYTGTETTEEKEIVRNIYNSAWKSVPAIIKAELEKIGNNNYMGEIIKIFMITASGAEGINLENTRYVHIVEPYWHPVRTEQVVGRARRICSHANLPEELRDVHVFLYLSVMTEEQKTNKQNIELRTNDISKKDKKTPVTTDEYLYEISTLKDDIAKQILKAVKETAMDCSLHKLKKGKKADDENLVCYSFGKVSSNEFSSLPVLDMDAGQETNLNVRKETIKGITMTVNGTKYIRKRGTNELYDAETEELVGTVIETADGKVKIELL
jgi:hypothetical protein